MPTILIFTNVFVTVYMFLECMCVYVTTTADLLICVDTIAHYKRVNRVVTNSLF